ncbi:hypothetical protein J4E85_009479 [Alternaria conjuncta]|uniref:uncharacterized protein n=1 Tax=Alternaria conjuncta TaxID=181017 RepID=UPI00221EACD5|nr:uncharacterized protein J4E85_009479 [Alternaria conjuncta]KAI4919221.1 hypothetical protein J4E85_009479 [Alternaria conjuncta]
MEIWNFGGQIAHGWEGLQATSPPGESAQTIGGATNHSDPIIDEAPGTLEDFPVTPVEGPYSYFGLYDTVTNSTQGRLLGEASTFVDWPVFDEHLVDPSVGDGFYSQMLPQLDPFEFLTQPSYPTAGLGQAFQPIAPAPALNAVVQPNIITPPSRAHAAARRRTIEPRFHCNIDGCTKAYRRVGDCRRHMRKHQAPNLRCVVEGCHMKFDRMDKLRDHVRQGHKMNL